MEQQAILSERGRSCELTVNNEDDVKGFVTHYTSSVAVLPLTVHTPGVADIKFTGKLELAVTVRVSAFELSDTLGGWANVIF